MIESLNRDDCPFCNHHLSIDDFGREIYKDCRNYLICNSDLTLYFIDGLIHSIIYDFEQKIMSFKIIENKIYFKNCNVLVEDPFDMFNISRLLELISFYS